ncbi:hypothetical protein V8017_19585 [Stenotrophomonas rhizophila]
MHTTESGDIHGDVPAIAHLTTDPVPAAGSAPPTDWSVLPVVQGNEDSVVMVVWRLLRQEPALIVSAGYVLLSLLGLWSSYFFYRGFQLSILDYLQVSDFLVAGLRDPAYAAILGGRRPAGDPGRLAGHAAPTQPGPGGRTAGAALGLAGAVFAFGADQLGHVGHAATHGCMRGGGVLHGAGSGHLLLGQG